MNRQAAKAFLARVPDLWEYFGLSAKGISHYKRREPFCPDKGPLTITAPKQLHYTQREGGVYQQIDGLGCPDLKRDVVAMLDGIEYGVMREAVDYVRHWSDECYRALTTMTMRTVSDKKEEIAERLSISRQGLDDRLKRACVLALEYIDAYLDKEVNKLSDINRCN